MIRKQYIAPSATCTHVCAARLLQTSVDISGTEGGEARSRKFWGEIQWDELAPWEEETITDKE